MDLGQNAGAAPREPAPVGPSCAGLAARQLRRPQVLSLGWCVYCLLLKSVLRPVEWLSRAEEARLACDGERSGSEPPPARHRRLLKLGVRGASLRGSLLPAAPGAGLLECCDRNAGKAPYSSFLPLYF